MNRETLCGLLVDHDREYLSIPVHLEGRDAHKFWLNSLLESQRPYQFDPGAIRAQPNR